MKAMHWLRARISDYWQYLSSLLAVGGLLLLYLGSQKQIQFIHDGKTQQISTHARDVGSLLAALNIDLSEGDEISPAIDQQLVDQQIVVYDKSSPVVLDHEGELIWSRTAQDLPENILNQSGLRLFPGDSIDIYPSQIEPTTPDLSGDPRWLRIDRSYPIEVQIGSETLRFSSSAATLGEALWEQGIILFEGDELVPPMDTPLDRSLEVELNLSDLIEIIVDGQTIKRRGAGRTVAEILANAGIRLAGLDYALPGIDQPPPSDGVVRVVRVEEQLLVELEPVEFETVYVPADQLELDTLEVLEPGTFGVESKTIRVRYEDGEELSRTVEDAVLAVEPKNRVIGYGTKIVVRTLDTGQGTIEYWRAIPIYATSYSPCNLGVPWCGTATASGKAVNRGIIGVIRSWYNLMRGWSVFVPNYGPGTFEDIGAGIAGRDWIDLGFTDENFEPWHQWTTLYFLTPVPPLDSIPWILP